MASGPTEVVTRQAEHSDAFIPERMVRRARRVAKVAPEPPVEERGTEGN